MTSTGIFRCHVPNESGEYELFAILAQFEVDSGRGGKYFFFLQKNTVAPLKQNTVDRNAAFLNKPKKVDIYRLFTDRVGITAIPSMLDLGIHKVFRHTYSPCEFQSNLAEARW